MPKYDAFGREIGEDTLSDWRGGDSAPAESAADVAARAAAAGPPFVPQSPPPPVAPAPAEPSFTAAPPPSPPPVTTMRSGGGHPGYSVPSLPRRRRRTRPRVVAWLIVVAAFVIGGNVVGSLDSPDSIVDRLVPEVTAIPFPGAEGVDGPDEAAPPVGLGQGSMIRPGPLRKALAELKGKQLGRAYILRLAPERIDAQMLKSGRMHSVQLTFDGGFREFSVTGGGFSHLDAYALASLDPTAPQRLVRAAAKRIGKPVSRINYLVASAGGWNAYFKGGQYFQGDKRGRIVRRIS